MAQAIRWGVEAAVATFVLMMLFGCADPKAQERIQAAEMVAKTACVARQNHPIVAEVLHQTLANMVPGGELAHGAVQVACNVVLQ
jgi:hypothetical protein